jgi:large subunit ribosomal protein L34
MIPSQILLELLSPRQICAIDTGLDASIFSPFRIAGQPRAGGAFEARIERQNMKRQYQPSKIRRKRQHGFLNRNASKSGRAILRNRRRVGRKRLTPV